MPYYYRPMGDYATGGYGRSMGDPGLFGFLGKIIKKAAPVLGRFFGPVGAVVGAAVGAAEASKALIAVGQPTIPGPIAPPSMPGVGMIQPIVAGAVQGMLAPRARVGGVCPSGYHPDKATGTRCVRNRRMNVANARALRRSMRRVKGFEKLARKTISFTKRVRIK